MCIRPFFANPVTDDSIQCLELQQPSTFGKCTDMHQFIVQGHSWTTIFITVLVALLFNVRYIVWFSEENFANPVMSWLKECTNIGGTNWVVMTWHCCLLSHVIVWYHWYGCLVVSLSCFSCLATFHYSLPFILPTPLLHLPTHRVSVI